MKKPDWTRKFWKPVYPKKGNPLATLADARALMIDLPAGFTSKNEWQAAAGALLQAANAGGTNEARDAITNALFLNHMLDLERE